MYKKLLVPLDGSALAEAALDHAAELVARIHLEEVILLHVYATQESEFTPTHKDYIDRAAETVRTKAGEVQQKIGTPVGDTTVEVRGELGTGKPAEEILHYAEQNNVDLIMMATHGRSGIKRWAMGSVADKVLRASKVPVWLFRAGMQKEAADDESLERTILVPLDGSPLAESVLPHVETLAKQRGTQATDIVLLAICEPIVPPAVYPVVAPVDLEADLSRAKQSDMGYLAGVEGRLKENGIEARAVVLVGKPADEIVDYGKNNPCDLIVMATHGRSGISRWVYGSVAEKLLSGASSPILLVRPHQDG